MREPMQAFEAWRAADREARAVEATLAQAWQRYYAHEAPPPSKTLFIAVSSARDSANKKLTQAVFEFKTALRGDHPR